MLKKAGIVFISAGAVLIVSALLLFLYNRQENEQAKQEAGKILEVVQHVIAEQAEGPKESSPASVSREEQAQKQQDQEKQPREEQAREEALTGSGTGESEALDPAQMRVVEIEGYGYIGYISIPAIELELPVMSDWDYRRLKLAPCRQFGSVKTDDLVIAGHNYKAHFKNLSKLQAGDKVRFTDMDGKKNLYAVETVTTLSPESVDAVQNSGYDLVLYTCTPGGAARVAVFCSRTLEK